jgi:ABC-type methionine transport system permease subunit
MIGAVAIIVIMVELVQFLGDKIIERIMSKRGER